MAGPLSSRGAEPLLTPWLAANQSIHSLKSALLVVVWALCYNADELEHRRLDIAAGDLSPRPVPALPSRLPELHRTTALCPKTAVWVVARHQRLPTVPVLLLRPDIAVVLDLQAAVDACFALVGSARLPDYADPSTLPPLHEADVAWPDELLRNAGLRCPLSSRAVAGSCGMVPNLLTEPPAQARTTLLFPPERTTR